MRWPIAAIAIALVTTDASAKRVVMDPPVVRSCREGKTWNDVTACLAKMGTPQVARTLGGAKLVAVTKQAARTWIDLGLYIYAQREGRWQLSGLWESNGLALLLDAKPIAIARHQGYRIDVGQASTTMMPSSAFMGRLAEVRTNHVVFCPGDHWACIDMVTACEVAYAGHTVWTFRGTLNIDGKGIAKVTADRTHAGPLCNFADRINLDWAEP